MVLHYQLVGILLYWLQSCSHWLCFSTRNY